MAADAASIIDQGSLNAIFDGGNNPEYAVANPILQCVQIKPLAGQPGSPERYRVVFSDIQNFVQSMLATQANYVVHEGKLRKGVICRLKSFQANQVKGKKIIIVLDLDVLEQYGECEKMGEPRPLEPAPTEQAAPQPTVISSNGFYGNVSAPYNQAPSRVQQSHASSGPSFSHGNVYPIEALSPYGHKWTIKARVTHKSDIKTWHNKNGEGKLFSVNLLDDSGEIKATGFNDQCDMFYDLFQEGCVYYISSPCRVNLAKKQFTNLNNDYELTFERETVVEKSEDQDSIPQVRFNFTNIGDLQSVEKDTTIDTIGVLKEVGEVSQIVSKTTSKPYDKRDLTLVDNTNFSVRLTIWGRTATNFDVQPDSVIAFKGVKVSDFGGRSLSLLSSGSMTVDPDIDEAHRLKGWYDAQGHADSFMSHASLAAATGGAGSRNEVYKSIAQIRDEQLGYSESVDYFTTKATVIYVKQDNIAYPACLSEGCNKKVFEVSPDEWRCERCDKSYPRPEYRYILSLNVSDHTGQIWLNCFDDVGRMIIGMSADQLMALRESDEKAAEEVFQEANCRTWVFKCRAKMDNFQDQQRVRYQVSFANPLNLAAESERLNSIIQLYDTEDYNYAYYG
ncbi:replication protein A 70 kDa DNA-binding subunit [Xylona heveae TC161]|uniref:Replication protein A subunit n=1 Tax=Xylona heveae (strain CBS 132557 / TC161) TaxID=1328760 RepID=A0A165A963_XYLHT|nr:replication protein A 70 kDa DNA-binding subunit [Xylona heveae TC161]KZF20117.1 replication protein A 70 kDa DNA-binding subunit [Xylona heveae TC161]